MRTSVFFLAILATTSLFYSCKKNDNATSKKDCKVVALIPSTGDATQIVYNSDGKIASITRGTDMKDFQYSGNTEIINETNSGTFYSKTIVTLNEQGLAANVRIEANAAGTDWTDLQFEYNGKELMKQTSTQSTGGAPVISTITWTKGNPVSTVVGADIETYDYYLDKPSQPGDILNLSQTISGYYSLIPKNALKSISSGGSIYSFSYTADADGKFTNIIENGVAIGTLLYQCN